MMSLITSTAMRRLLHSATAAPILKTNGAPAISRCFSKLTPPNEARAALSQPDQQIDTVGEPQESVVKIAQTNTMPFPREYDRYHCDLRREWLETVTNSDLSPLGAWWGEDADTNVLKGNIEAPLGVVQLPLSVVGPLKVTGDEARGDFFMPLATTEGALIASANRGAAMLYKTGGIETSTGLNRCHRVPVFITENPKQAMMIGEWAKTKRDELQEEVVSKHTRSGVLKEVLPFYDGEIAHIMLRYETGDASGQNMVTTCSYHAKQWLLEKMKQELPMDRINLRRQYIDIGLSGDKRPSGAVSVIGRGIQVAAKAVISDELLLKYLHVDGDNFLEFHHYVYRTAAKMGQLGGFAVSPTNSLAAIYAALGQDVACLSESACGQFDLIKHKGPGGGVEVRYILPNLMIGTVGGGTGLPAQSACLKMLGCHGPGKKRKLAEVVAAAALSLDLSTLGALAADEFCQAHDALGKNRPEEKK